MTSDYWAKIVRPEQVLPPGAKLVADPISRLQAILDPRAVAFAEVQFDAGADLRITRGLLADEAASFLRGLDAGLLTIDATGGVRVAGLRPKPGGGRYSLFSANRYGGDLYVSLNLEYLIQLGAEPRRCPLDPQAMPHSAISSVAVGTGRALMALIGQSGWVRPGWTPMPL